MSSETALAFINKVLLKLHKDSNKKHIKLREGLKHATDLIKDPALKGDESVVVTLPQWGKLLNSVVATLKLAVEAKSHKFSSRTLDLFLRLIANGLVPGAILDEEVQGRLLLEKIVDTIRLCADTSDDATLMQVVKVVQAISASSVCGLHGNAMLNCFKIVYRIHLNAKAQTQLHTTSRSSLLHVLNAPFKVLRTTPSATKFKSPLDASSVGPPLDVGDLEISAGEIELLDTTATPPTIDTNLNSNGNGGEDNKHDKEKEKEKEKDKDKDDDEQTISSSDITPREEREEPDFIAQSIKDGAKAPPPPTVILSPRADVSTKPLTISCEGTLVGDELRALNDCLLLFNHLCKLSANSLDTELEINSENLDQRNKHLALELLYTVLESSGPSFRNYERFIHQGLREHLSVALMVNGNSPHPKIYKLVLSTFLHVLSYFRDFMKDEIEDFVTKILLRSLETTSMMQQRWMSLQVVLQICKNPQTLLDIFINYDCDLEMRDIFERIVNDLSKVSQGNFQTDHKTSPLQDSQIKLLALESLVVLLQSMVEWSHPLYDECQKMSIQSAHGEDPTDYITEQIQSPSSPTTMKELIQQADQFSKQKQFKMTIEKGKPKFAISAKKGVQYFLQIGVIKHHPEEVALFFKNTAGLDKVKIGEYIGEKDDFNLEVMQCYVNLFNFAKCDIDIALRQFLSGFRLPGEAQKIDRIMEKFAERYYQTNQDTGTFASAESAYILAFAIVLLATDLHSSQIKKHMTKEEWVKMNRGNNAKQNFDEAYLLGIYDRIGAERLKLHAEGEGTDESREFVPKSSSEIRAYHSARNINHVKSMFSTAWHAVLAAFSVLLDQSEDPKVVALILTGFKHAVRVSGIFSMDLERAAFITSLSKFTVLESLRDMKQKHIDSIVALIGIATMDGNYIVDSWSMVQRCVSFLDRVHIYGVLALEDANNRGEREKDRASSRFLRNQKNEGIALDFVVQQIDSSAIDKLYNKSNLLSSAAVLALIKAVCEVSTEEIYATPPSLFSLQKLADIIYLNLYRVRPVWTKIWAIVAEHFIKVGQNDNLKTSMFAIETLRGIVIKVLEQEDLSSYSFQKELIRPFEIIFVTNLAKDVQELIINSFSQIILARGNNISSGWKSVFSVFSVAASEEGQIMCLAFELIEEVLREYFHCIADVFFVDCVNSFTAFANNKTNRDVSLRAIESLNFCAVQLANGRVCQLTRESSTTVVIFTDTDQHMSLWFPLLTGLARAIGHHFDDIRASALDNLFRVLSLFGSMFSAKLWELVFRGVLLPIFDNIGYSKGKHDFQFANSTVIPQCQKLALESLAFEENPWLTATCMSAFKAMVDLFTNFIEVIDFLLEDMLDLFVSCILQDNEYLSRISCNSLVSVITANGPKFTQEMWTLICDHLSRAFYANTPYEISDLAAKKETTPTTRPEPRGMFLRNSDSTGFNSLPSRLGNLTDRPSTSAGIISQVQSTQPATSGTPVNASSEASPPLGIRRRASVASSAPLGIPANSNLTGGPANQSLTDLPRLETIPASPPATISSSAPVTSPFLTQQAPPPTISVSVSVSTSSNASPAPSPAPSPSTTHIPKARSDSHPPFSTTAFAPPTTNTTPSSSPSPHPHSASHSSLAITKVTTNAKHQNTTPPVSRTASVHDELSSNPSNSSNASNLPTPDTRRRAASVAGVPPPTVNYPVLHSTSVPEIQKLATNPPPAATPSKTSSSSSFITPSSTSTISSSSATSSTTTTGNSFLKMGMGTGSPPVVSSRSGDLTARMRSRCIVQLLLIHAVDDIALSQYAYLLTSHLVSLIECLEVAYTFSHKTNKQQSFQEYLTKTGAVDLFRKQEINSISSYLTICFKLYGETQTDSVERKNTSEARLIPRIKSILSEFVDELDVVSKIPIIKQILRSILQLEESQFEKNMAIFYTLLMNLMLTDNRDIRTLLRDIMHRLGKVKKLTELS